MVEESSFPSIPGPMAAAADVAIRECLALQEGEKLLIVTNPQQGVFSISCALFNAARQRGVQTSMFIQAAKSQGDNAEDALIAAFDSQPDAVASLSHVKMGKDLGGLQVPYDWDGVKYDHIFHYQLYGAETLRAFWSPSISAEMFIRLVPIDYPALRRSCQAVKEALDGASAVRVSAPGGTQIELGLRGRVAKSDDGDFSKPGRGGNLPAGETFISPENHSAQGRIVFDGSLSLASRDILLNEPVKVEYRDGFITSIEGGEGAQLLRECVSEAEQKSESMGASGELPPEIAPEYRRNARALGELGIGLNPQARIAGNMLEDEKACDTCHFAIGHNYDHDGPALIHLDGLIRKPTITAILQGGGELVIQRDGRIVL